MSAFTRALICIGALLCFALGYSVGGLDRRIRAMRSEDAVEACSLDSTTNIVDNGLAAWISDTNHTFGPQMGKRIFVLKHGGKFWIRFRQSETNKFETFFVSDRPYESAEQARHALAVNIHLQTQKMTSDAIEDAFK